MSYKGFYKLANKKFLTSGEKIMECKTLGLICILIATTGFGIVNLYLNSKILDLQNQQEILTTERNSYSHAYERFALLESRKLSYEIMLNIGLLFSKIDYKFSGETRPQTQKGIQKAEESMLEVNKNRLLELAYTAASSKVSQISPDDYVSQIKKRLGDGSDRNKYDKIQGKVVAKINAALERVQDERDNKKSSRIKFQRIRDISYIVFLIIQIVGLYFTFAGESKK